jgi:uncharacterized protein (DUF2236 family)
MRQQLGEALFTRVAGPDGARHRERIHGTPGPRWFDPASPIGRVHGDAAMFVGGLRAVLLQTLHPAAMTAVSEHSGYRGDMWGRLARTSRYLAVTTFGTAEHAQQAVDAVRAIHLRVTGTLDDGTPYAASDPHLLMWVHVAQVDSFLRTHQTYGRLTLDQPGRDEYVAQCGEVAQRLGVVDPPATEAALTEVLEGFRPELRVTDHAREAVRHLLWHPDLPYAARPAYGVLVAAAIGSLPDWARRELRLPWAPVTGPAVTRALGRAATSTIRWALTPRPLSSASGQAALARGVGPGGHVTLER